MDSTRNYNNYTYGTFGGTDTAALNSTNSLNMPSTPPLGATTTEARPEPETVQSSLFVPGFLQTQIGKLMRVEFLIGSNTMDRVGVLVGVGASYILLQPVGENDVVLCDLFSIKFVTIVQRDGMNSNNVIVI